MIFNAKSNNKMLRSAQHDISEFIRQQKLESDESEARGADDGVGARLRAELGEDGINVEFDSVLADRELLRDRFVRETASDELQDFYFARGERFARFD